MTSEGPRPCQHCEQRLAEHRFWPYCEICYCAVKDVPLDRYRPASTDEEDPTEQHEFEKAHRAGADVFAPWSTDFGRHE